MTAGDHVLEVTRVRRSGTAELKVSYPGPKLDPTIEYDANDHATVIDDGITRIAETLSPQGRVIEREVTDSATGELLESVTIGYAGPGDNRAYEIIHQDGPDPIVTYIAGPGGLLTIDTAGVGMWPLDDGHGHTLGTADGDGGYTANPLADEFGVMPGGHQQRGDDQLDWLGGELRHRTGDAFGLIRMGVRLYDPALGRFLGVDPIDGGSANTYDYCNADPINCRDLTGEWTLGGLVSSVKGFVHDKVEELKQNVRDPHWYINLATTAVAVNIGTTVAGGCTFVTASIGTPGCVALGATLAMGIFAASAAAHAAVDGGPEPEHLRDAATSTAKGLTCGYVYVSGCASAGLKAGSRERAREVRQRLIDFLSRL